MTVTKAPEKVFKCSNCGGPLNYTPETIVCVCEYCGTVNWFSAGRFEIFILPTRSRDEVVNAFWSRMKRDPDMSKVYGEIELMEVQGFYIPVLLGDVSARGGWVGFKRITEKRGKSYVTRTVTERGSFDTQQRLAVEARREAAEYGLQELISQAKSASDPQPLAAIEWKKVGLPVLNAEVLSEEAVDELKDMAEDELRESIRSSKGLDGFYFYSCETNVNGFWILLVPLWSLVYKYKGGMYRVSVSGYNLQSLRISEPVFLSQRIIYLAGSTLTVVAGSLLLPFLQHGWLPLGLFILASAAGAFLSSKSISDIREEKWK